MSEGVIHVLDSLVADQIAAGEVVERPASVVKELVENSLDAGARKIRLEVDAGGAARLRVVDNGMGIRPDELQLAFTRHATSKIQQIDDLETVASYGFRGEALPSIASVSKIVVHSRQTDVIEGVRFEMAGGKVTDRRAAGCPVGTDIEVRELFYNTPARLKFLKKESTENGHCAEALIRLALVRPDVSFEMVSSGRKTRSLPKVGRIEERVAGLFPGERLVRSEASEFGISALVVLGPPEAARAGAGSLYTYVNGRFVRDRMLLSAITQAFGGTLPRGRYPAGLVALTLPPGSFDVNVHPQKTEVRFNDQSAVYRTVRHVLGAMVSGSVWAKGQTDLRVAEQDTALTSVPESQAGALTPPEMTPTEQPLTSERFTQGGRSFSVKPAPEPTIGFNTPAAQFPHAVDRLITPSDAIATNVTEDRAENGAPVENSLSAEPQLHLRNTPVEPTENRFADLKYIGQAKNLFLLCEDADDLVVVDQHAAHERVTFERLRDQLKNGGVAMQQLLVGEPVDLGPAEAERVEGLQSELARLGLEVSRSGPDRVTIRGVPAQLAGASPTRLLADMVIALGESRDESLGDIDDHVVATMACHSSIRAGQSLDPKEVGALFAAMDHIDFAGHCPHGRPVLTRIPWSELKKRVGRG